MENLLGERFPPIGVVDLLIFFERAERPFTGRFLLELRESNRIMRASIEAIYNMDSQDTR